MTANEPRWRPKNANHIFLILYDLFYQTNDIGKINQNVSHIAITAYSIKARCTKAE